jgi:capsular exopolysaccharide synthesis family protein
MLYDPQRADSTADREVLPPLRFLLQIIWRRKFSVMLIAILLVGVTVGFTFGQTPTYVASIKLLVSQEKGADEVPADVVSLQELTATVAEVIGTRPVAEAVIRKLDLNITAKNFLENVDVQQVSETQVIEVAYKHTDPQKAQEIVNTIGEVFSERISEVSPSASSITVTVWERAALPDEPVSPNPLRNVVLALMLGLLLGSGLAIASEILDDSWRSPEAVEEISERPNLGVIPEVKIPTASQRAKKHSTWREALVTVLEPGSAASEAYRTLRTNLLYALTDIPPRVILITSPGPREGKSTICANLAVVLGQADKSVLILDCDLRNPIMHKIFELSNIRGLVDAVAGECELREIQHLPQPGVKVVTSGALPFNPSELVGSRRFGELLAQARNEFDYVLLDSSPIGLVSDPVVLATETDGVLLVLDVQHTGKWKFRSSIRSLETVGATFLGTIMNKVKSSDKGYPYAQASE